MDSALNQLVQVLSNCARCTAYPISYTVQTRRCSKTVFEEEDSFLIPQAETGGKISFSVMWNIESASLLSLLLSLAWKYERNWKYQDEVYCLGFSMRLLVYYWIKLIPLYFKAFERIEEHFPHIMYWSKTSSHSLTGDKDVALLSSIRIDSIPINWEIYLCGELEFSLAVRQDHLDQDIEDIRNFLT